MIGIHEDRTDSGRWLTLQSNGVYVIGAHLSDANRPNEPLTIMWFGAPKPAQLAKFCSSFVQSRFIGDRKRMRGLGFASGHTFAFEGTEWERAAALPDLKLFRFEIASDAGASTPEIVIWASLDAHAANNGDPDAIENVGVNLRLRQLSALEDKLSTFIAATMTNKQDLSTVRETLRILVHHINPRSAPTAATA